MGRSGSFRGLRRPLAQTSTNAGGAESVKSLIKSGWRLSSHFGLTGTDKSVRADSCLNPETSAPAQVTAPRGGAKSEEAPCERFVTQGKSIRGNPFTVAALQEEPEVALTSRHVTAGSEFMKPGRSASGNRPGSALFSELPQQQIQLNPAHRLVVVPFDPSWSMNSVLSQVCGGPLERVGKLGTNLEICFLHSSGAQRFYNYARSGQFVVRGEVVRAGRPLDVSFSQSARTLSVDGKTYAEAVLNGARRSLVLYQRVADSARQNSPSQVTFELLQQTFGGTGSILQIRPMFARHTLAYVIYYEDISSAINAKHSFDQALPPFNALVHWKIKYIKDCTERPCMIA